MTFPGPEVIQLFSCSNHLSTKFLLLIILKIKHHKIKKSIALSLTDTVFIILINEPRREISDNVVYATSKALDQPARTRSLIIAFASRLNIL